ncbi:hypothetical protein BOO86_15950 [Mycobacterium sp. CBMA 234]|uniref:alpha/beta fold hydrolase n=1 Tax=Mycolicibacterium sp. CBMA 234 TaxID=1918495 RepID=UPI0012DDF9D8|nr:alpha/beta hydrolase [Mycolicibacterium sp. CBMA 234]MUL65970.1 hypothetical protein [Mycolicibacterium sp. CBMA 234]
MTLPLPQEDSPLPHWTKIEWRPFVHDAVIDGRHLRFVDCGSGPALVLLHGMGASWQWWLENLPALARQHRVIALDLPGFGKSDPLPKPAEITTHASTVTTLLSQLDVRSATITGHSMGGLVALAMAKADPHLVHNLVLVGAGGVPMTERRLQIILGLLRVFSAGLRLNFIRRALAKERWLRQLALRPAFHDPAVLSPELAEVTMPLLNAPGFVDAVAASGRAVRESVPEEITCPVLLLWGEYDRMAPVHCAEDMHRRLADSELVIIPGSGHTPAVERPEQFNDAVLKFTAAHQN